VAYRDSIKRPTINISNAGVYSQALVEGIPNLMDIPYILEVHGVLGVIGDIPSTLLLGFWSLIPVSGRLIALVCRVTCIQLEVHWRNPFSHVLNVLIEQVFSTNPVVPFNCLSATLSSWKHSTPHEMRFLQPQCCPFSRGVTGCRNVPEKLRLWQSQECGFLTTKLLAHKHLPCTRL
jgi:hypothetical protein